MHLIGINGFKRSGKGTVANIVAGIYNDGDANVVQVGFADKLKILAAKSLGFTDRSNEECIALMDEAKEHWLINICKDVDATAFAGLPVNVVWHELTGREFLQHLGNEARQVFGDTFWIDMVLPDPVGLDGWLSTAAHDRMTLRYPDVDCLCITDLRYPNEAERIKALGGTVWEVLRPGLESDGHASEQPLPRHLVDHQIDNSSDLGDLQLKVERAMDELPS